MSKDEVKSEFLEELNRVNWDELWIKVNYAYDQLSDEKQKEYFVTRICYGHKFKMIPKFMRIHLYSFLFI